MVKLNRKLNVVAIIAVCVLASILLACYLVISQPSDYGGMLHEPTITVGPFDWNVPVARVQFNVTMSNAEVSIDHIEINSFRVDSYPDHPDLRSGQTVLLKVYFPFHYNTTYDLRIVMHVDSGFGPFDLRMHSPPEGQVEALKIHRSTWDTGCVILLVANTGSVSLSVSDVSVNGSSASSVTYAGGFHGSQTLKAGALGSITITRDFTSGAKYEFSLLTATGNKYTYVASAP